MGGYLKSAFRNIFRKKARSFLTMTGIGIGVLSVVVISAIGDLGKQTINDELSSIGLDGLAVSASAGISQPVTLYTEELEEIKEVDSVEDAMPLMVQATQSRRRGETNNCIVWGIDNNAQNIISLELLYGRMITKGDLAEGGNVCVVDEAYAKQLYGRANIVGKTVEVLLNGGYQPLTVIGVVASGGNMLQSLMGEYIPSFLYIPYSTMQRVCGRQNFDQIAIRLQEGADPDSAAESITTRLESISGMEDSIQVENLVQQKEKLNNILDIITLVLAVIAGISLVVAGLSIMTVMLVSVSERTREIGIKKSIGASRSKILWEFLAEALLISLLGSGVGCGLGIGLSWGGCAVLGVPYIFNGNLVLFCIAFAVATGILFGVYPAMKAAKLRPVEALRQE